MTKEFIPYQEALELKKLDFDKPCFGYYDNTGKLFFNTNGQPVGKDWVWEGNQIVPTDMVLAPTFSQAFKFFREKYGYDCSFEDELVYNDDDKEIEMWDFFIYKTKQASVYEKMTFCSNNHDTYVESFCREEAELFCLRKLIEIVNYE